MKSWLDVQNQWRVLALFLICGNAWATDLAISGADARNQVVNGEVSLFLIALDDDGQPVETLKEDEIQVYQENPETQQRTALEIQNLTSFGHHSAGVDFLLLIDDSGSMYDGPTGDLSPPFEGTRAAFARREAKRFINDLGISQDRVGLAFFATKYHLAASPRIERGTLVERLGVSSSPSSENAYTELYAGIEKASETLASTAGRRIVILFSDGENYPYYQESGNPHPEYGTITHTSDQALKALRDEAVTLYAVRFGDHKDAQLAQIALASGGLVFDVDSEDQLAGLYSQIRHRVSQEYRIDVEPQPQITEENRFITIWDGHEVSFSLPSSYVFGPPVALRQALFSLFFLPFFVIFTGLLWKLGERKSQGMAQLSRLEPRHGEAGSVTLAAGKTVIAPHPQGQGTLIVPAETHHPLEKLGTTIIQEKDGRWQLTGNENVKVNNCSGKQFLLSPGDVIQVGDDLIVFDDA
ncbi:MAG: VWA domain-containing protein [Spirochaetales bacterium]|nr:VWA domain-containing protein [Spirochaetales bacterium]